MDRRADLFYSQAPIAASDALDRTPAFREFRRPRDGVRIKMNNERRGIAVDTSELAPLVSVVICLYNAGEYFRPSLKSILDQNYSNLDIVVIDDGSTDGSLESAADLLSDGRVRVFRQDNAGKPAALNRALDLARGEFYAIHDADDISFPTRIAKQVRAMRANRDLAAVFCGNELIIQGRSIAPIFRSKSVNECRREVESFQMPAHDPTGMFRMSLVGTMRYSPELKVAETFDYILRIGEKHPMEVLGECLYGYRILPNSLTRRDPSWRQQFVADALRKACLRRGLDYEARFASEPPPKSFSQNSIDDNNIAAYFINSVLDQRRAALGRSALRTGFECVRLHPFDLHYYKALIYAVAPGWLLSRIRPDFRNIAANAVRRETIAPAGNAARS